ncbi:vacuolar cation/proton exchanger 2-like isoform X3 [Salvia miltiorrhiza]|uniref:vacuolar cation/proton exchanger 2-like isoform X3 n=1 Tax=Salvia miltiorrhiza TaxID=226208 RepID=UPI0025AC4405|nr:vacuolar cation/proton exchanger 2-like isoform X3 [Salvia miltiorrhiza]
MADTDSPTAEFDSHLEMGSLAGKSSFELEGLPLFNSQPIGRKTSSVEITPQRCIVGHGSDNCGSQCIILRIIYRSVKIALFSNKLNLLVACGPSAILVDKLTRNHGWVFFLSLLGIVPLAERLGWATEQLAFFTGPTVGGLLNATFGNATEMIISMLALQNGMIRVVQQSLLGSILSNLLLVLGCALFGGGLALRREQVFNKEESPTGENSDDEEVPDMSKWESIMWLFILTCFISVLSQYLVNAIEGASVAMNIPVAFISVILLPIVGNAAEHAGAVMFAVKDKLDISLGVAIGSSTQIAMFVIPFTVVVGWIMGLPMDLNFKLFETATLIMTVLVVAFMLQEGTTNYFKGLMLLLCYLIVAASFFVHIDDESSQDKPDDHP